MKNSNVVLLCLACLLIGFVAGVGYTVIKGEPEGLHTRPTQPPTQASSQKPMTIDRKAFQDQLVKIEEEIKRNPDDVSLKVKAGHLLFDNELYKEALVFYERALEIVGENANLLTDMGIAYRRLDQPQKAIEYFRRARKADPKHQPSALNLGIVLFHDLKNNEGAVEAWREYLALNPQGARADMIRQVVGQLESQLKSK